MRVSRSKIRKMIKEDFAQNEMNQRLSSQITMTLDDLIKVVIIASNAVLDNINERVHNYINTRNPMHSRCA